MQELKPCPFCGNKHVNRKHDDGLSWEQCTKCEATGPAGTRYADDDAPAWNTRPTVPQQPVDCRCDVPYFTHPNCKMCGNPTERESVWHPIKTAPKDGRQILVWANEHGGNMCLARWSDNHRSSGYWVCDDGGAFEWDLWTTAPDSPLSKIEDGGSK